MSHPGPTHPGPTHPGPSGPPGPGGPAVAPPKRPEGGEDNARERLGVTEHRPMHTRRHGPAAPPHLALALLVAVLLLVAGCDHGPARACTTRGPNDAQSCQVRS